MASKRAFLYKAIKRNTARFPEDFMFQLSKEEFDDWRSQFVISNPGTKKGLRYAPYAFTEQGVAMSSVLRTQRAVDVNIAIVRTFVKLRQILASNEDLARKVAQHDRQIAVLFDHVQKMLTPAPVKKSRLVLFIQKIDLDCDSLDFIKRNLFLPAVV